MKKIILIIILLVIIYLITMLEPQLKKINEIQTGEYVRIQGVIQEYAGPPRITILSISDETGSIKTIFFEEVSAWKGMKAEVTGRVEEYKGEKELKGVKIRLLE